jgi:hypothetical protein
MVVIEASLFVSWNLAEKTLLSWPVSYYEKFKLAALMNGNVECCCSSLS